MIPFVAGSMLFGQFATPSPAGIQTDLSGSRFQKVSLANAQFYASDFSKTTFRSVNLSGATLTSCNLSGAEISSCNISGMKIDGVLVADLIKADQDARKSRVTKSPNPAVD
jgi:uncharacterized protein YjbI with pentapeptide repeats